MADDVAQLVVRLEAHTRAAHREIEDFRRATHREMDGVDKKVRDTGGVFQRLAGKIDGAKLGVGLAAVATGFVVAAKRAVDHASALDEMSRSANIGVERLQSLRFAADESGAGADFVTEGLERLNRSLDEFISSGAGPAKDALEALGLAGDVTSGKLQAGEPAFDAILQRLDSVTNESERATLAAKLFGDEAGPRMLRLLSDGSAGVRDLEERFTELGATISEETIKEVVAVRGEITALSSQITGQMTAAILQGIGKMIDFAQSIGMVSHAIGKVGDARLTGLQADLERINGELAKGAALSAELDGKKGWWADRRRAGLTDDVAKLEAKRLKTLQEIEAVQKSISTAANPVLTPTKPGKSPSASKAKPGRPAVYDHDGAREAIIRGVADAEREYAIAAKASDSAVRGTVDAARDLLRVERENAELQIAFRDARQSALDDGATYKQAEEIGNLAKRQVQFRQQEQYELERLTDLERDRAAEARAAERVRVEDIRAREDSARKEARETARIAREAKQALRDAGRAAEAERRDEIRETDRIAREASKALRDAERAAEEERRDAARAQKERAKEELDRAKAVGDALIEHMRADLAFRDAQAAAIEKSAAAAARLQEESDKAAKALAQGFAQAIAQADSFEDALERIGMKLLEVAAQGFFEGAFGVQNAGASGGGLGGIFAGIGSSIFDGLPSFDGGGGTGGGARSGGVDGRGGFPAILHPNETIIDHTRGGAQSGAAPVTMTYHIDARGAGPREVDALRGEMRRMQRTLPAQISDLKRRGKV